MPRKKAKPRGNRRTVFNRAIVLLILMAGPVIGMAANATAVLQPGAPAGKNTSGNTGNSDSVAKEQKEQSAVEVLKSFDREHKDVNEMSTKEKHIIMFVMGVALLVMLLTTLCLGIAMVMFEKKVFVAHMVMAGFSVTLAIIHSIVGIVWFFPF